MNYELLKLLGESVEATEEMKSHFKKKTDMHISLVRKYAQKIMDLNFPEVDNKEVQEESDIHDHGKWADPEYEPYLHISWHYREKDKGREYKVSKEIKDQMDNATFHHITTHKHHPEYWDKTVTLASINRDNRDTPSDKIVNAVSMPLSHIATMMADWLAMSEEKNTNIQYWIKDNVNIRWKFTKEQVLLVNKIADKVKVALLLQEG